MKISTIQFGYLRNEAHYQFLLLVKKLFEAYPNVANIVSALLTPFYTLLALEGKLVDIVRGSEYTKQMAEATFDGHELIFTVDNELSYRDNTAPVTLHGKGAFKGKKTVSFNIVGK